MAEITITDREELYGDNAKYKGNNLFVEAGAGAGKTETVINLIIDQLYSGVEPERIVVITFTNKATEELINRISSILIEKIKDANLATDKKAILQNALNNIYKMNVSTIHHFCNVILNENSYKAKLSFNSTLLEEEDELKRQNKFYYEWIRSLNLQDIFKIANSSPDAFKNLRNTFTELCKQFDDISVVKEIKLDYKQFLKCFFEFYEELDARAGVAAYGLYAQDFVDSIKSLYSDKDKYDDEDLFNRFIDAEIHKKFRRNANFTFDKKYPLTKDEIKELNEELKDIKEKCASQKDLYSEYTKAKEYEVTNIYACTAWEEYKKSRDRASLTNNQLIYETYMLLQNEPNVKDKLANQYDVIYVDEFQDTDRYQNKFIMDLAKAIDERKKKENKMSTSIVVVGDPKQSIYGFRGADFNLYMDTKDKFPKSGLRDAINVFFPDNYRSNRLILEWVNKTYAKREFYPGYQYTDMKLPTSNELPSTLDAKALAGVYSFNFNKDNDKFNNLTKFIKEIVAKGCKIYSRKRRTDPLEPREIKYSDFLVLTTSHSEINDIIIAFNKENIKTQVAGEFDLGTSKAFNYLYRILMYLLGKEPNNLRILEKDFNASLYDNAKLEKLKGDTASMSPYGKLVYVINHIDLILNDYNDCDKEMLKTIIAQVRDNVCYDKHESSIELIDRIDNLLHTIAESQISIKPKEDAVQVMNVHKAKGLTCEIVIVLDSGGFSNDGGCCVVNNKIYLHNISLYPTIKEEYDKAKESEKLRLEYVAATRAKQVLVFESNIKSDKQLFNRKENEYDFNSLGDYHVHEDLLPIDDEEDTDTVEEKNEDEVLYAPKNAYRIESKVISLLDPNALKKTYDETSPSSLEKHTYKAGDHEYNRPANNIFGTLFHRVMELFVLNNCKEDMEKYVKRAVKELSQELDDQALYEKYLIECANATCKLFKESKIESYKTKNPEYKFYDYNLCDGIPTLLSGSIDLLLKNDDKVLIIDYKTDTNPLDNTLEFEDILRERYRNQLQAYKNVVAKLENIDINNIDTNIVWLEEKDNNTIAHLLNV